MDNSVINDLVVCTVVGVTFLRHLGEVSLFFPLSRLFQIRGEEFPQLMVSAFSASCGMWSGPAAFAILNCLSDCSISLLVGDLKVGLSVVVRCLGHLLVLVYSVVG